MAERYIIEYAAAKKRQLAANELMNPGIKKFLFERINKAIKNRNRGWITADEAIKLIGGFVDAEMDLTEYME